MELEKTIKITCPSCENEGDFTVYENINTKFYPDLKEKIKSGELFVYKCPSCGTESIVDYGLIYQDPEEKVLIQYYKNDEEKEGALDLFNQVNLDKVEGGQEISKTLELYEKRLVGNLEALREKIQIFDKHLDDKVIEVVKLINLQFFMNENPEADLRGIYFVDDGGEDLIIFECADDSYAMNLDPRLYEVIKENMNKLELDPAFIVDERWAMEVFDRLVELG